MSNWNRGLLIALVSISTVFSQNYLQISAGGDHSLTLGSDGQIYAWGSNDYGQLGDGNGGFGVIDSAAVMVDMTGVLNGKTVSQIAAGFVSSFALTSDGNVYAWGANDWGQLGDGNGGFGNLSTTPIAIDMSGVLSGKTVSAIASSGDHVIVLASDGKLYGWGNNYDGQLGNGANEDALTPVAVDMSGVLNGKTISKLVTGYSHTLVLTSDNELYTWGTNEFGQLGSGGPAGFGTGSNVPVAVDMSGVLNGKTIVEIAAHGYHSIITDSDGQAYAWGQNWQGELGDDNGGFDIWTGTGSEADVPIAVDMSQSLSGKTANLVGAGSQHSLVLAADGTLHTFGSSEGGKLGNGWNEFGVYADSSVAVDMTGVLNGKTITAIAVGENHNLVLASDGYVYAWGSNWMGALGDGSLQDRSTPVKSNGGAVEPTPKITVNLATLDFGLVEPLDSLDLSLFVKNIGAVTLNVDSLEISTAESIRFLPDTTAPLSLAAGDSIEVTVRFKPQALGAFSAPLKITSDGGDTSITVSGTGGYEDFPLVKVKSGVVGTLALTADGRVYSWGAGWNLGVGDHLPFALYPIRVKGELENKTVIDIESGWQHSVALTSDGEVYIWGSGNVGELGVGVDSTHKALPTQVQGLLTGKTIVDIAGGDNHTLALSADGELFGWGMSLYGQLGIDQWEVWEPIQINVNLGDRTIQEIAGGNGHSMFLTENGEIFTFGSGPALGYENASQILEPRQVGGELQGKRVRHISAGGFHSQAVTEDGELYVWGANEGKHIGLGAAAPDTVKTPTRVTGLLEGMFVVTADASGSHSLAVTADGGLFSWGVNTTGRLGDGTTDTSKVPQLVMGDLSEKKVLDISAGAGSVVLTEAGEVYTMGLAYLLGTGTFTENSNVPVYVFGSGLILEPAQLAVSDQTMDFGQVIVGYSDTLEVTLSNTGEALLIVDTPTITGTNADDFSVINDYSMAIPGGESRTLQIKFKPQRGSGGDLTASLDLTGNGGTVNVSLSSNGRLIQVTQLSSGSYNGLVMDEDGQIYGWGYGYHGELGQGTYDASRFPVETVMDGALAGKDILTIEAGGDHAIALSSEGKVYNWGYGRQGQMGIGIQAWSNVPIAADTNGVLKGKTVTTVAGGGSHTLILTDEGKVYGWGMNSLGQIGLGYATTGTSGILLPSAVKTDGVLNGKTFKAIAGGGNHSLALGDDGKLYAWGAGNVGQLGNGSYAHSYVPVEVTMTGVLAGKNVTDISAGSNYALALTTDGKLYTWGRNNEGQLGNGSTDSSSVPVEVDMNGALAGKTVQAIAAGGQHALILTTDNKLFSWGRNDQGQLGDASEVSSATVPVQVKMDGELSNKTIAAVAAGYNTSYALTVDGEVYVWGYNGYWQLGDHAVASINEPLFVFGGGLVMAPELAVTSTSMDFGKVAPGDSLYLPVQIKNVGTLDLHLDPLEITGSDASLFSAIFFGATTVEPGDSLLAIVQFKPIVEGEFTATLNINSDGGMASINLSGAGGQPQFVQVSAGGYHSLGLTSDGKIFSWGYNNWGQLGAGGNIDSSAVPVAVDMNGVLAGKKVTSVHAGLGNSFAITDDGQIFAWGWNEGAQLGDGNLTNSNIPVAVDMSGALAGDSVVAVSGGYYHTLALTKKGNVYAWGINEYGMLGAGGSLGEVSYSAVPVAVDTTGVLSGKEITNIAAGYLFSVALSDEGVVYTWGYGTMGALGGEDENHYMSSTPVVVDTTGVLAGKTITDIGAGYGNSVALSSSGDVFAWGYNMHGELGNGNAGDTSFVPVAVVMDGALQGKKVQAISTDWSNTLALADDGKLYSWGGNSYGELGAGSDADSSNVPVAVNMDGALSGKSILSFSVGAGHSLALTNEGQVFGWGFNRFGELGNGENVDTRIPVYSFGGVPYSGTPLLSVTVNSLDFGEVTTGDSLTMDLLVRNNGDATLNVAAPVITGDDASLFLMSMDPIVLGAGARDTLRIKFKPTYPSAFTASLELSSNGGSTTISLSGMGGQPVFTPLIATGYEHSLAFNYAGELLAWGLNDYGQLGTGDNSSLTNAAAINLDGILAGKTISAIAAGVAHTVVLTDEGEIYTWGGNTLGQLGNGSFNHSLVPVRVGGDLADKQVVAIASRYNHTLALTADGKVYGWGHNIDGELGVGNNTNSNVPVLMGGELAGKQVVAIATGFVHSLALTSDGKLYVCGYNSDGRLGIGTNAGSNVPVLVEGELTSITVAAIAAGDNHSMVMTDNGELYAWGRNTHGQLGNGDNINSNVPIAVSMDGALATKQATMISSGNYFNLVKASDGNLYSWGYNAKGQLGNGTIASSNVPVAVDMTAFNGKGIKALAGGQQFALVMTEDAFVHTTTQSGATLNEQLSKSGAVQEAAIAHFAWGSNANGQLGDGTTVDKLTPTPVPGLTPITVALEELVELPTEYALYNNYPNPFNPITTIRYDLPEVSDVSLTIYDIRGRMVSTMSEFSQPAGTYEIQWNGTNQYGAPVSTGVYLARIQTREYSKTIKMLFLK
ncbi:MAG: choice-of-anchor D domain-containing protein [Candidatus Marinimicrobia bacterium]|nr:choice-of-anchor D domain-containing protein [Candidatus Neomarinimicrobiota bacterium]